jgi:hypothetical protein
MRKRAFMERRTAIMGQRSQGWFLVAALALLLAGCPGDTEIANGNSADGGPGGSGSGRSGSGAAGRINLAGSGSGTAGRGGSSGGSSGSGGSGMGSAGASGGSSGGCPNALPALCRMCADNSCGEPVCVSGRWQFRCPEDGNAGAGGGGNTGCFRAGCSGELCATDPNLASDCLFRPEYACYQNATCERQANGQCG